MTPLETAFVILISIWSAIFIVIAIFLIIVVWNVQKLINKINKIVETTENMAENVSGPLKMVVQGISSFFNSKKKSRSKA